MKRWICLFLSLVVCVSALSLGVHAEEEIDNSLLDLYVYSSIVSSTTSDFATEIPQQGAIIERSITNNTNQQYSKIKNFSFTCPANSYFLIDFDIVAYDPNNLAINQRPYCFASRNITQYISSDFTVSGSNGSPSILRAEVVNYYWENGTYGFVHFSIFGLNDFNDMNNIVISYQNPIIVTASTINATGFCFNQRIQNVNCKTSVSLDTITNLMEEISSSLNTIYFEVVSIGDTLGKFYNEFHSYWVSLNTRIANLYLYYYNNSYVTQALHYNSQGIASWSETNQKFPNLIRVFFQNVNRYLQNHTTLENKAMESGANDAYSDLNDSANFGSLSDFAGAGSAASWSSGSFSNGLSGVWDFFSNDTFYDLDTTVNRHDGTIYHEEYYQNSLSDYFDIVGSDYDGSASDSSN